MVRYAAKHFDASKAGQAARKAAAQQRFKNSRVARMRVARAPLQPALRGFLGADAKFHDVAVASYVLDTTGSITHLDVVPQGTSVNDREGKAWQNTSLQIRGSAVANSAATVGTGAVYIVWDKQPNKALPAITDILDSANAGSFTKRENALRFKIVRKLRYNFEGNQTTAGQQTESTMHDVDEYIRLPGECVALTTAADTTGAIGNRISGALLAVTVGTVAAGTGAASFSVRYRLNFKDI